MKKNHFVFISLKRNILPIIFCLFTVCLIIFSRQNLQATKNGLALWANSIVPALLPFFIVCELLSKTSVISFLGKILDKCMRPIFNVPRNWCFSFYYGSY